MRVSAEHRPPYHIPDSNRPILASSNCGIRAHENGTKRNTGPDNDPSYSPAHEIESPQFSPVATYVEVALDEFLAGNPDSDRRSVGGYVAIIDPTAPLNTSLDLLTHGNPDSGVGVRFKGRPTVEVGDIITAQVPAIEPDV